MKLVCIRHTAGCISVDMTVDIGRIDGAYLGAISVVPMILRIRDPHQLSLGVCLPG